MLNKILAFFGFTREDKKEDEKVKVLQKFCQEADKNSKKVHSEIVRAGIDSFTIPGKTLQQLIQNNKV